MGDPLVESGELVPPLHVSAEHGPVDDVACGWSTAGEHDDVLSVWNELAIAASKQSARPPDQCLGLIGVPGGHESDAGGLFAFRWARCRDLHRADRSLLGVPKHEPITDPRAE